MCVCVKRSVMSKYGLLGQCHGGSRGRVWEGTLSEFGLKGGRDGMRLRGCLLRAEA